MKISYLSGNNKEKHEGTLLLLGKYGTFYFFFGGK